MDLTTVARVKALMELSAVTYDALIQQIVSGVSGAAETFMARHAERVARTEDYNVECGSNVIFLKGYPVDTGATFTVKNDPLRAFTGSAMDSSWYHLDAARGRLVFDKVIPVAGPGVLRVTYTGGMAVNVTAFISSYPEVAMALEAQCAFLYQRKGQLGASSVSSDGGSISLPSVDDFLPMVKKVLELKRRKAMIY